MENVGTTTTEEKVIPSMNGWAMVGVSILAIIMGLFFVYAGIWGNDSSWSTAAIGLFLAIAGLFNWNGVFTLEPNTSTVFTFVGEYKGTVRDVGIRYINPFFSGQEVSLRSFSSEIERVKVNDANGNPIEISGVFVAEIQDTARAEFDVDDFEDYLNTQAGMALRDVSAAYPFESNDSDGDDDKEDITLKGNPKEVGDALVAELQKRLDRAGAKVLEAGLGHCAYAPEIAEAMLQKQQAAATVAARKEIVEGAVGIVEQSMGKLKEINGVEISEESAGRIAGDLMIVLSGHSGASPVISVGSK